MRSKLYIFLIVIGLSIFTYSSDSQDGPGVGAYTSLPSSAKVERTIKEYPKKNSLYCVTGGSSIAHGWIDEVVIGQYEFVSGSNSGYADLTNREFDIECGSFNTFDIRSGQSNSTNKHNWRLWIDYDRDGEYANDEQVISNYSVHMKGLVYIPAMSKLTYRTGMRIAMNMDEIPSSCGSFKHGEVEDYTVVMKIQEDEYQARSLEADLELSTNVSNHSISVYPNPASLQSPIMVDLEASASGSVEISVFSIDGRLTKVESKQLNSGNNKLNIEGMIPENGVYLIKIQIGAKSFIKKITVIE